MKSEQFEYILWKKLINELQEAGNLNAMVEHHLWDVFESERMFRHPAPFIDILAVLPREVEDLLNRPRWGDLTEKCWDALCRWDDRYQTIRLLFTN